MYRVDCLYKTLKSAYMYTVDPPYKILFGTQEFGSILDRCMESLMGYLIRSGLVYLNPRDGTSRKSIV